MSRIVAGILALLLSSSASSDPSNTELRFIFLTPFVDYAFFNPVKKGVQDGAKAAGVQVIFDGTTDGDVKMLASKVTRAVEAGYDGIALNMIDPVAFDDVVAAAIRNNVPVIAFNVDDNRSTNARLAAVGQNMLEAGRKFGREISAAIPAGSEVLITMHDPGISALEDRMAGIKEVLKPRGIRWQQLITSTDRSEAMVRIRKTLEANPSIKFVIGTGSADTEAAGLTIEQHFRNRGYTSAGFDLSPDILRLIKAGTILFSVDQQPYSQGYFSVVALTLYKRYGLAPASIDTGATLITAKQVDKVIELSRRQYR